MKKNFVFIVRQILFHYHLDNMEEKEKSQKIINFEKWLDSYLNFEKTPKKNIFWLKTMDFFCGKLGQPQNSAPCFHVAGSKGKGSISLFIASILEAAGFKAGLYTSPHILDFLERVTQAGRKFDERIYENAADELESIAGAVKQEELPGGRGITWFELVTIFAFLVFRQAEVDFSVYEVGLGGRLDSTNVVNPLCECIGPIELEHTEFLGGTVEKIAAEKGGIIKKNSKVVIARQAPSVRKVFEEIAEKQNAKAFFVEDEIKSLEFKIQKVGSQDKERKIPHMEISFSSRFFRRAIKADLKMLGRFQAENAALASLAVKLALPEITEEEIEAGLSNAALPARFETELSPKEFKAVPYVVLDGAHTVNSVKFTMETMEESGLLDYGGKKNAVLLFACAADKDVADIAPLFKGKFRKIYLTRPGNVKQSNPEKMKKAFSENGIDFDYDEDFSSQIKKAFRDAERNESVILATGSFYLAAEVKKIISGC